MHFNYLLALAAITAAIPSQDQNGATNHKRGVPSIPNLQIPRGEKFIGSPATANPLQHKPVYKPEAINMHQDGGNTGTIDYPGPLGNNLEITTALEGLHILLWTKSGQAVAGYTTLGPSGLKWGLAAVDDEMKVQDTWYPEIDGQTLNVAYMELLLNTDQVVVTSKEGQIYIVQVSVAEGGASLELAEMVSLTSTLAPGELLMNAMYDTDKNLWFSSGGLRSQGAHGDDPQNSSTIGYLPSGGTGEIHAMHIENQMIENGIAIKGTTAYVITGPSGEDDKPNAKGHMYAFGPGPGTSLTAHWKTEYEAGDIKKPGSFARGSGATPALLDDQYIAITDNANGRINLVIYHQDAKENQEDQVVCKLPMFQSGSSNIDFAPVVQKQDDTYGIFLCNDYNAPPLYYADTGTLNGDWNNLTQMAPGIARVDVTADGNCELAWEVSDLRIQSVPLISTKNGLVYGYTQSVDDSEDGVWVWYVVALDWRTGKEVWRVRSGAGGTFNDDYQPGALEPDGSFYQSVIGGVVRVRDGK